MLNFRLSTGGCSGREMIDGMKRLGRNLVHGFHQYVNCFVPIVAFMLYKSEQGVQCQFVEKSYLMGLNQFAEGLG